MPDLLEIKKKKEEEEKKEKKNLKVIEQIASLTLE